MKIAGTLTPALLAGALLVPVAAFAAPVASEANVAAPEAGAPVTQ